jgi:predicted outer membrane protein
LVRLLLREKNQVRQGREKKDYKLLFQEMAERVVISAASASACNGNGLLVQTSGAQYTVCGSQNQNPGGSPRFQLPSSRFNPNGEMQQTDTSSSSQVQEDVNFVGAVAEADAFEIAASKLVAQCKNVSSTAERIAEQLISDHTNMDNQLKELLQVLSICQVPVQPVQLTDKHQSILQSLKKQSKSSTTKFTQQFYDTQKSAHEQLISTFEDYISKGNNADLMLFAKQYLPTLKRHLVLVQQGMRNLQQSKKQNK